MDFRFSDDQLTLTESVRDYLAGTHGPEVLRRLDELGNRDPAIWQGLVEMGLPGLLVPEEHGGLGLGLVEAALIAAECGRVGGTIAHGYLTMSLVNFFLPDLIEVRGFTHAVNVGADRLRFLAPVKVGSRIRGAGEIVSVEEVKGAIQSVVRVTIEIEGSDKPACVVDTISRYFPEN